MTNVQSYRTPGPEAIEAISTEELRRNFLIHDLFTPGELRLASTDLDRLVIGGAMPRPSLRLADACGGAFLDRRELGVMCIGGSAVVRVDNDEFPLGLMDTLYVGSGAADVEFRQDAGDSALYLVSAPAHHHCPTARLARAQVQAVALGDQEHANRRCIYKAIHPGGIASCQLVMGFTELQEGSVWNTMPPHTHLRRSEIYLYLGLDDDGMVVHLMGEPARTRSLIVRDRDAVLSPAWSIHSGAGTRNYRFVWAMAGENQDFGDMDGVRPGDLA